MSATSISGGALPSREHLMQASVGLAGKTVIRACMSAIASHCMPVLQKERFHPPISYNNNGPGLLLSSSIYYVYSERFDDSVREPTPVDAVKEIGTSKKEHHCTDERP